jgi:hypothetical protein
VSFSSSSTTSLGKGSLPLSCRRSIVFFFYFKINSSAFVSSLTYFFFLLENFYFSGNLLPGISSSSGYSKTISPSFTSAIYFSLCASVAARIFNNPLNRIVVNNAEFSSVDFKSCTCVCTCQNKITLFTPWTCRKSNFIFIS